MVLIRSLLFQAYFYLSVVVFGTGALVLGFWPKASYSMAYFWCRGMLAAGRVLCGLEYMVEGRENIPDEASVILSKHSSVWEVCALIAIFPRQCWVLKRELFWVPFFGWGLRMLKPIPIDRKAGRTAVKQVIGYGKERLAEGIWVTVFPEGTRVMPGTTRKYGISGAALASEAGAPIVPVAHNAGDFWPRRSVRKTAGLIRVRIGPPVDATAQPPKDTNVLVQNWIEDAMREISSAYVQGSPNRPDDDGA